MTLTTITIDNETLNIDAGLLVALNELNGAGYGQIAAVHDYVSGTTDKKCIKPQTSNKGFIAKFHYKRLVARWNAAALPVQASDIDWTVGALANKSQSERDALFADAKAAILKSYDDTLNPKEWGDNAAQAQRDAHERNYRHTDTGVKVNLVSEATKVQGADGKIKTRQIPVKDADGRFTVASLLLPILEIRNEVTVKGEWKPTKSQAKTLVKNQIEAIAHAAVTPEYKMLSLKADNFSSLKMSGEVLTNEDIENVQPEVEDVEEVAI